ncbi:hypothetical protein ACQYRI_10045 [Salmonella enterica]
MKNVLLPIFVLTATISFAVSANQFTENMERGCSILSSNMAIAARKQLGYTLRESLRFSDLSESLCKQSYMQASADYEMAKAVKSAVAKYGPLAEPIVINSYKLYKNHEARYYKKDKEG